jgi:uncharacterized membrane protein YfcA
MHVWLGLIALGLAAGGLSGLVGIGGGIILVPALVYLFGLTQHQAQGTTLALMVAPLGAFGAWNYFRQGLIDFRIVLILAVPFAIGALLSSGVAVAIPEKLLTKVFGGFLLLVSLKMLIGK